MQIQLTKTKTITIGGGAKKRATGDLVGVDLFTGDARGCPAVRVVRKKGALQVAAVGFVPPPASPLPSSWEEAAKSCSWSLPAHFQAPHAALAVTSDAMSYAQTTPDAFKSDLAGGAHPADAGVPKAKKFGIRRPGAAVAEKPAPEKSAATPAPEATPGVPVSHGGTRFVMKPMAASDGFVMEASLPEYQALWLSRLLPEGRRPTAASVQLHPAAVTASVLRQGAFAAAGGTALALFVEEASVFVAGYRGGELALWRRCRGARGRVALEKDLAKGLGLEPEMVASALDDGLVDPRPVLEPLAAPILDELAVSRDYFVGKLGVEPKSAFLFGMPFGVSALSAIAEDRLRLALAAPDAFDGLALSPHLKPDDKTPLKGAASHVFLGALGAALAVLDDEEEGAK